MSNKFPDPPLEKPKELPKHLVWKEALKMLHAAELAGSHSSIDKWQTKCDSCGEWVDAIYTIVPLTHVRLCRKCGGADKEEK